MLNDLRPGEIVTCGSCYEHEFGREDSEAHTQALVEPAEVASRRRREAGWLRTDDGRWVRESSRSHLPLHAAAAYLAMSPASLARCVSDGTIRHVGGMHRWSRSELEQVKRQLQGKRYVGQRIAKAEIVVAAPTRRARLVHRLGKIVGVEIVRRERERATLREWLCAHQLHAWRELRAEEVYDYGRQQLVEMSQQRCSCGAERETMRISTRLGRRCVGIWRVPRSTWDDVRDEDKQRRVQSQVEIVTRDNQVLEIELGCSWEVARRMPVSEQRDRRVRELLHKQVREAAATLRAAELASELEKLLRRNCARAMGAQGVREWSLDIKGLPATPAERNLAYNAAARERAGKSQRTFAKLAEAENHLHVARAQTEALAKRREANAYMQKLHAASEAEKAQVEAELAKLRKQEELKRAQS
jgi:hypothetical protein